MFNFTGVLLSVNSVGISGYNSPVKDWFEENSISILIIFIIGFILGAVTIEIKNFFIELSNEKKYSAEIESENKNENEVKNEDEKQIQDIKNDNIENKEYKNKRG